MQPCWLRPSCGNTTLTRCRSLRAIQPRIFHVRVRVTTDAEWIPCRSRVIPISSAETCLLQTPPKTRTVPRPIRSTRERDDGSSGEPWFPFPGQFPLYSSFFTTVLWALPSNDVLMRMRSLFIEHGIMSNRLYVQTLLFPSRRRRTTLRSPFARIMSRIHASYVNPHIRLYAWSASKQQDRRHTK